MSSAVTGKGVPVKVPSRSVRSGVLRFVRMAVAFVVVAGSLGLATVTATAQSESGDSVCPSEGADNYSDVVEGSTHADDIACLRELGISEDGDMYRPGDDMTRSEMAAFMANAYEALTGMEAPIEEHDFTDIADDPNAEDIARISPNGLGITRGTSETMYSPDAPVIRGHMALFLTRLYKAVADADAPTGTTEFTDIADISEEQQTAIGQIFALGVTTGTTDTTYSPSNNVTRAQMGSFVARMYRAIQALADAPGAPTGVEVAVSGEDGDALDVSWTAPEEDGGAEVTGYVVQWKSGDDDYSDDSQLSVDGTSSNFDELTKGTEYTFRVAAVNDAGQGEWSDEASGSPAVVPGVVGDLTSTPGNGTLTLSWIAPEDDGGSEITGYVVSWRTGRQPSADTADVAGDATGYTITGLSNSASYSVWVEAVNAAGTGEPASVPAGTDDVAVSPRPTAASAPQNLTVTPGNEMLTVSWSEPAEDGGTTLIDYTIERRCGDVSVWGNSTPVANEATSQLQRQVISSLTNGDACEVRVRANSYNDLNDDGSQDGNADDDANPERTLNGPWAEGSGTPVTLPDAPGEAPMVTPAHQSLQITWDAPAEDGGSDITGYKIMWTAGIPDEATVPAEPRLYTITGLDNRYQYSITIKTITAVGESEMASTAATGMPAAVPAAPTNVTATPPPVVDGKEDEHSGTTLVVNWNAPPANGTSAVTGYVVQHRNSAVLDDDGMVTDAPGIWTPANGIEVAASVTTHTFTSLTNGTSYDVRVRAQNDADPDTAGVQAQGGPYGVGSGTPATRPAAVATTEINPGYTSLDVSWVPPADNGSDITHYLVRYASNVNDPFSSDMRVNAPGNRIRLTGLAVGVPYAIQIQAVNGIGTGPNPATDFPASTGLHPEAPSSVTAVPKVDGDGTMLTVTWTTVTQTNGTGTVGSYIIETLAVDPPGTTWTPTTVSDPALKTMDVSVVKDTTYLVRVKAVSTAAATGIPGYAVPPVKAAGVPDALTSVAAEIDSTTSTTINVTWDSVPEGDIADSDITGYVVTWVDSGNSVTGDRGSVSVSGAGTGSYAITGLAPGTYTINVHVVNHVGRSTGNQPATAPVVPEPTP